MNSVTFPARTPRISSAPFAKARTFNYQLWKAILGIDLLQVERKLIFRKNFDENRAKNAIAMYRKYLYLVANGYHCSPDSDTDEA